jgi:hypothetical protein
MAENNRIVETILKSKALGYFIAFWGATFLIRAIADFEYYIINYGTADFTETMAEMGTWIIYDIASIAVAITLFMVAMNVLKAKK